MADETFNIELKALRAQLADRITRTQAGIAAGETANARATDKATIEANNASLSTARRMLDNLTRADRLIAESCCFETQDCPFVIKE